MAEANHASGIKMSDSGYSPSEGSSSAVKGCAYDAGENVPVSTNGQACYQSASSSGSGRSTPRVDRSQIQSNYNREDTVMNNSAAFSPSSSNGLTSLPSSLNTSSNGFARSGHRTPIRAHKSAVFRNENRTPSRDLNPSTSWGAPSQDLSASAPSPGSYSRSNSAQSRLLAGRSASLDAPAEEDEDPHRAIINRSQSAMPFGFGGWSPVRSRPASAVPAAPGRDQDERERRKSQVHAYVAWVNAQLKKSPGVRPIEDLKCDMQDGVSLAILIQIVAGIHLDGVHMAPSSITEKMYNIEQVINFMTSQRIRMHHTTAKDIVEGNLKSIMRLILALAAHYKPNSVKHSVASRQPHLKPNQSLAGMAQTAAAALGDARRDAANVIHRPQRPRHIMPEERQSGTGSDSDHAYHRTPSHHRGDLDGASNSNSSSSPRSSGVGVAASHPNSPRPGTVGSPQVQRQLDFGGGRGGGGGAGAGAGAGVGGSGQWSPASSAGSYSAVPKSRSQDFVLGQEKPPPPPKPKTLQGVSPVLEEEKKASGLKEEHSALEDELHRTRSALMMLQDLLLTGRQPDGEECCEPAVPLEAANQKEEISILQHKLQMAEETCKELRQETARVRSDNRELQAVKAALQQRLAEQEHSFLVVKAELLRADFLQQSLENTKADLEVKLNEKDKAATELRRQLSQRDRELDEIQASYHINQQEKESAARTLRSQINDLNEKLKRVGDTEVSLSARVSNQDRKMAKLENKILQTPPYEPASRPSAAHSNTSTGSDDLHLVRESLRSLRSRFPGDDPQHQTIDALEQSISSLMDKLYVTEQESSRWSDSGSSSRRLNFDSTGDARRSPIAAIHGFPVQRLDHPQSNGHGSTKVLYFTDRTVTPFMCSIPKRLGEIKLRDIKNICDRQGNFRYHFKAMDPEFGTVKEEITHDEDVVPGWEGKIVAWIEED